MGRLFDNEYHRRKDHEAGKWMDERFSYMEKYAPTDDTPWILAFLWVVFIFFPVMILDLWLFGDD